MKFYDFIYAVFNKPVRALFRISATGLENVPSDGGFLMCANHTSLHDVTVVPAVLEKRRPKYMAKKELFKIPLLKQLITAFGAFPVDRGGADVGAVKMAISLIQSGESVFIFPQGHRHPHENVRDTEFHHGVGMIAYRANCDVLPVYIKTDAKQVRFFRKTEVIFGKLIKHDELGFENGGTDEYKNATALIFDRICDLGEPK